MQSPVATGAANESIDPSARKERGPQDDKGERTRECNLVWGNLVWDGHSCPPAGSSKIAAPLRFVIPNEVRNLLSHPSTKV